MVPILEVHVGSWLRSGPVRGGDSHRESSTYSGPTLPSPQSSYFMLLLDPGTWLLAACLLAFASQGSEESVSDPIRHVHHLYQKNPKSFHPPHAAQAALLFCWAATSCMTCCICSYNGLHFLPRFMSCMLVREARAKPHCPSHEEHFEAH